MRHRRVGLTLLGVAGLLAAVTHAEPPFTSIQPELFAAPGSLANAWADYDNDGDLDFAVSLKGGAIRLYRNDAGRFVQVGTPLGLPAAGDEIRGLSWGDFDNDGDVDLLAGSNVFPIPTRSFVYRNEGSGGFREVAAIIGLTIPGRFSRQANWVDVDNDGDLDVYAANRTGMNRLFLGAGGEFTPLPFGRGLIDPRRTVGACWFDMDRDGDLDAFLANQSGDSDALWRNDGDRFVDVAPELGMDQTQRRLDEGGVGCAVGDYDNDGDFDLYVATYGDNLLYRNDGSEGFAEVAAILGVTGPDHTVGAAWGDYDNDGDLDLFAAGYRRRGREQAPLDALYRNDGVGFRNVLTEDSPLNAADHGVEWVDFDNDGDLDLSVTDGYGEAGGHFLFRNDLADPARAASLKVLVLDSAGHFTRAGAEVRLYAADASLLGTRLVATSGGYNTQSAKPVHFGVPNAGPVTIEVTFLTPEGRRVQRTRVTQRPAGSPLRVAERP